MPDLQELRSAFRAHPIDGTVNLAGYEPADTPFVDGKDDAKDDFDDSMPDRLFDEHELLYAEGKRSVLVVLQGLDASGKNGTIKHVFIHMNPVGVKTASFVEPTEEEKEEHFLERYRRQLPGPGTLGVFNRSYYEDVIVPVVMGDIDDDEFESRIEEINEFEAELDANGTTIIKCMLNISYDEQRRRFLRRLRRDDKRWKYSSADVETRRHWNAFLTHYGNAIGRTSTDVAPWYVIPSDNKWYRNWAIAHLSAETLASLGCAYPQPDLDLEEQRQRLAPPN